MIRATPIQIFYLSATGSMPRERRHTPCNRGAGHPPRDGCSISNGHLWAWLPTEAFRRLCKNALVSMSTARSNTSPFAMCQRANSSS